MWQNAAKRTTFTYSPIKGGRIIGVKPLNGYSFKFSEIVIRDKCNSTSIPQLWKSVPKYFLGSKLILIFITLLITPVSKKSLDLKNGVVSLAEDSS